MMPKQQQVTDMHQHGLSHSPPTASTPALPLPQAMAPSLDLANELMRCQEEALARASVLALGEEQLAVCARTLFLGQVGQFCL